MDRLLRADAPKYVIAEQGALEDPGRQGQCGFPVELQMPRKTGGWHPRTLAQPSEEPGPRQGRAHSEVQDELPLMLLHANQDVSFSVAKTRVISRSVLLLLQRPSEAPHVKCNPPNAAGLFMALSNQKRTQHTITIAAILSVQALVGCCGEKDTPQKENMEERRN